MGIQITDQNLTSVKEIFELHTRLFLNVLEGISENDAQQPLSESTNHIAWLTGHIASSRHAVTKLLGGSNEEPYPELFSKGKGIEVVTYPSLTELKADWADTSDLLMKLLDEIEPKKLESEAPFKVPLGNGSIRSLITFFAHHEAYHIGQIGIARRYFDYDAMKYS